MGEVVSTDTLHPEDMSAQGNENLSDLRNMKIETPNEGKIDKNCEGDSSSIDFRTIKRK